MALKPPELTESTWLGATISVGGLLCGMVGVAAIIWNNPLILLGIAAGSGWILSIVFAVLYASQRRATRDLQSELAAARSQASEWSATSSNVSESVLAVLDLIGSPPSAPRRRRTKTEQGDRK